MKNWMTTTMLFLFMIMHTHGQNVHLNFSEKEVTDLFQSLHKKMDDTARIDILLRLSFYHVQKEGNEKTSIDSAAAFIKQATAVNAKQRKRDGAILWAESSVARERGDGTLGKQLLGNAIPLLQGPADEFYLTMALLEYGYYYQGWNKTDTAELNAVLNKLFLQSKKIKDPVRKTEYSRALSNLYYARLIYAIQPTKLFFLDHFILLYKELGNKEYELRARKEIADVHYQQNEIGMAMKELLQLLKEHKAGGYPGICFTYDLLAAVYIYSTDFEKALYYALETVKSVNSAFDSTYLPDFYVRLTNVYDQLYNPKESLYWFMQRFNYTVAKKELHEIYYTITQIAERLGMLGKPKEGLDFILKEKKNYVPANTAEETRLAQGLSRIYHALGDDQMAEKYNQELIRLAAPPIIKGKEITFDLGIAVYLTNFYLDTKEYSKAEIYYKKAVSEWEKVAKNSPLVPAFQHNILFRLDSAKGNYRSAMMHLLASRRLSDSMHTVAKSRQIEQFRISYDVDQKDKLLDLNKENIHLLTQQRDLQKSKLRQGTILRNITFAAVLLLIIIAALLYNKSRMKQRTNKKLESQQQEISAQNISLRHLVNEKEWLVKEIHHRVKNNLQIVMSLLNSQSAYIDNEDALTAIHDSQHRVHAMSLIHQKLYSTENVSSIYMSLYIRELTSYLADSFDIRQRIRFELNIEPLEMDVSQAVPLGLILNEAITNSIKYAFPHEKSGIISVSLCNTSGNHYLLSISDNGVGLPADLRKTGSLGMSLMKGLSEDLDGNFSIESNNGTLIKISFVHHPVLKPSDVPTISVASKN